MNTLPSKDRLLSVANVLSRGRLIAGWGVAGGGAGGGRKPMSGSYEH